MTMDEQLLAHLDEDELIRLLQRMIQFRSYSAAEEEGPLAHFLADYLREIGLSVELQEVQPGRFNVIGTLKGSGSGESVMYNGHIDTNPVGLGWTVNPLAGVVKDGFIYGIGVSNMKASDAAFVAAVRALVRSGIRLKGDVVIGLVVGELQHGIGTVHLIKSGVKADWFINGEPTDLSVMTLHAGAFEIAIHVYGVTRHMSKAEEGVNAIEKATKVIEALRSLRMSGATKPEYAGLNRYNVGVIRGGVGREYLDWRIPQVPDMCTVKVAFRYAPSQTPEGIIADVQAVLDRIAAEDPDFRAEIESLIDPNKPQMKPFEVDQGEPVVQALVAAHRRVLGEDPRVGDVAPYKYYGTDAAHLLRGGFTGAVYGCGGKFNTMPDERVELRELAAAARVYALSLLELCNRTKV